MGLETTGGRQKFYGPAERNQKWGAKAAKHGSITEVEYEFTYDDLPAADDGNEMNIVIPADSLLLDAYLKVGTAWAGGTSIDIGLVQTDGTAIDADGIDASVATASLTADAIIAGDGALIGASIGSDDAVVEIAATGTYTAGSAKLLVRYIELPVTLT